MSGGVSLGGMSSSGPVGWVASPTTLSHRPNPQGSRASSDYYAGLHEKRVAALGHPEQADEPHTGIVRGKRRSRPTKRDREIMVNGKTAEVKMEMDESVESSEIDKAMGDVSFTLKSFRCR